MKQPPNVTTPESSHGPLDPQQFSLHARTDATAGRDKVREVVRVPAPRQSKRLVEETSKSRSGT